MLEGLAYIHDKGVIHRNIKPYNIFFTNDYVKIADFEMAMEASRCKPASEDDKSKRSESDSDSDDEKKSEKSGKSKGDDK